MKQRPATVYVVARSLAQARAAGYDHQRRDTVVCMGAEHSLRGALWRENDTLVIVGLPDRDAMLATLRGLTLARCPDYIIAGLREIAGL